MATKLPMPSTTPSRVSADRPGRWSSPASASLPRSGTRSRDGGTATGPRLATRYLGGRERRSCPGGRQRRSCPGGRERRSCPGGRQRRPGGHLGERTVADGDLPLRPAGNHRIVRDDDQRRPVLVQGFEQFGELDGGRSEEHTSEL